MRRPAAVAGTFYPDDAERLQKQIDGFLADVDGTKAYPPKAIIAPHAGTVYSGPIAASAYARVDPEVTRVVVVGPAHRVPFVGVAVPTVDAFETPLGEIPLDRTTLDGLVRRFAWVVADDRPHAQEHSIELHLPFLQRRVNTFQLVPLLVGRATGAEVAEVLTAVWGGNETLIVCSTDLSHFHPDAEARRIDAETAALITSGRGEALDGHRACGYLGVQGLLTQARARELSVELVDLRNSCQTAGDAARVVGYAAFALR